MIRTNFYKKFLQWRLRHLKHQHFVTILSVIVGLLGGLSAVVIKNTVHFIKLIIKNPAIKDYHTYLFFIYPLLGITLVVIFLKYILKKRVGHGVPMILYAISRQNSIMEAVQMYASIITSSLTVGFGGSVGLEGPTVATGAAIGSNIGRAMHLHYKSLTLMIACGTAGAMAGIFKAPIAAIVFVLEVLMVDLTTASIIPLLLASTTGFLTSIMMLGDDILLHFDVKDKFILSETPYYIIFGVFCGIMSIYFNKTFWWVESIFEKIKAKRLKLILGALFLGILIYIFPPLYGEGYESINNLLHSYYQDILNHSIFEPYKSNIHILLIVFLLILLTKVFGTAITFGAGGIGGVFAPVFFSGAFTGFIFASAFNLIPFHHLSVNNFTLVGMAGMLAGVLHAPLCAIFLIAEITNGYELLIPLLICSTLAYLTVKTVIPHSIYAMQLAKRGELITHHKDKAVLTMMKIDDVIEKNFMTINYDATLKELIAIVTKSKRNLFPVIDNDNKLIGVITLDDIREIMFKQEFYNKVYVRELMHHPLSIIIENENMETVMKKFKSTGAWNLPVVTKKGHYLGFISKSKMFNEYRKKLLDFTED